MYTCDADGAIAFYNEEAVRIWGRAPEPGDTDELFYGFFRLYLPDESPLPHSQTPMAQALRTGNGVHGREIVMERPDGSRAWNFGQCRSPSRRIRSNMRSNQCFCGEWLHLSVNASPLCDENGEILYGLLTAGDIGEIKRTERALSEKERLLRDVMDNMVAMIGLLTPDGTLIRANRTALEAADLIPEDVLGKPFEKTYWWAWSTEVQNRLRSAIERCSGGEGSRYDEVIRVGETEP